MKKRSDLQSIVPNEVAIELRQARLALVFLLFLLFLFWLEGGLYTWRKALLKAPRLFNRLAVIILRC